MLAPGGDGSPARQEGEAGPRWPPPRGQEPGGSRQPGGGLEPSPRLPYRPRSVWWMPA